MNTSQPEWLSDAAVGMSRERAGYCDLPPYDPSENYPEWPGTRVGGRDNPAYRAVRSAFASLGLDSAHLGTRAWNPLVTIVRPGDTVIIKPNLVSHVNFNRSRSGDTDCLITHGSMVRAVGDYVIKALAGSGNLIIGDCPIQDTDWQDVLQVTHLEAVAASLRSLGPGVNIVVRDFRLGHAVVRNGVMIRRFETADDGGSLEVDLGDRSLLEPITRGAEFGVSRYPRHRMRRAHAAGVHKYLLARDFVSADVMITMPKLKTHAKAGITCSLKNFVGINRHKDYLPHFRYGSPRIGGDEYPNGNFYWDLMWKVRHADWDRESGIAKMGFWGLGALLKHGLPLFAGRPRHSTALGAGGWNGNDTLWRTVLDVNRAYFYWNGGDGVADSPRQVRYLAVVDGLVGGDHEGPLAPDPVYAGLVLAGRNPVAVDTVAAEVMGFDHRRIPVIMHAFELSRLPLVDFQRDAIRIHDDTGSIGLADIDQRALSIPFMASRGFRGHIEHSRG